MEKKKKPYKSKIDTSGKMHQIRYEIAKKLGYIDLAFGDNWWDALTNKQKSEIQGIVTKLLVTKAQVDMKDGKFTTD